jgi:hypothetical protein
VIEVGTAGTGIMTAGVRITTVDGATGIASASATTQGLPVVTEMTIVRRGGGVRENQLTSGPIILYLLGTFQILGLTTTWRLIQGLTKLLRQNRRPKCVTFHSYMLWSLNSFDILQRFRKEETPEEGEI